MAKGIALVTGAGTGIGRAIAGRLVRDGAAVSESGGLRQERNAVARVTLKPAGKLDIEQCRPHNGG